MIGNSRKPTPKTEIRGVVTWVDSRRRHIDFAVDDQRLRMSGFSRQGVPPIGADVIATVNEGGIVLAWREA